MVFSVGTMFFGYLFLFGKVIFAAKSVVPVLFVLLVTVRRKQP